MADNGPAPEDTVDVNIQSVKKLLQKLSCTYVSDKNADSERYHKKEPELPDFPKVIPDEGTSVDPPTPGAKLAPPLTKAPPLPSCVLDEADGKIEAAGDAVKVLTDEVKDLKLDDPCQYNMHHNARGLFVLFNVANFKSGLDTRKGTGADAQLLETTFKNMNFEVIQINDPKATKMVEILETVASYDHSNMDCVAVGILTHGSWDRYLRASDNKVAIADTILAHDRPMKFEELTAPFRAKNCHKTLKGKPKLFFIQACRGGKLPERAHYMDTMKMQVLPGGDASQQGSTSTDSVGKASDEETQEQMAAEGANSTSTRAEDEGDPAEDSEDRQAHNLPESMPIYKDFLVAWSTAPGYFSFRNEDKGSIYIQRLCRYLQTFHATTDLLTILTRCNSDIAHTYQSNAPSKKSLHRKKQMPWFFSRLTKDLIFTPKPPSLLQ